MNSCSSPRLLCCTRHRVRVSTEIAEPTGWDHQDPEAVRAALLGQDLLHSRFYHGSKSSQAQLCKAREAAVAMAGG